MNYTLTFSTDHRSEIAQVEQICMIVRDVTMHCESVKNC